MLYYNILYMIVRTCWCLSVCVFRVWLTSVQCQWGYCDNIAETSNNRLKWCFGKSPWSHKLPRIVYCGSIPCGKQLPTCYTCAGWRSTTGCKAKQPSPLIGWDFLVKQLPHVAQVDNNPVLPGIQWRFSRSLFWLVHCHTNAWGHTYSYKARGQACCMYMYSVLPKLNKGALGRWQQSFELHSHCSHNTMGPIMLYVILLSIVLHFECLWKRACESG